MEPERSSGTTDDAGVEGGVLGKKEKWKRAGFLICSRPLGQVVHFNGFLISFRLGNLFSDGARDGDGMVLEQPEVIPYVRFLVMNGGG